MNKKHNTSSSSRFTEKMNECQGVLSEAYNLFIGDTDDAGIHKLLLVLMFYKRFDDLKDDNEYSGKIRLDIPDDCRWNQMIKAKSGYFKTVHNNFKKICSMNNNLSLDVDLLPSRVWEAVLEGNLQLADVLKTTKPSMEYETKSIADILNIAQYDGSVSTATQKAIIDLFSQLDLSWSAINHEEMSDLISAWLNVAAEDMGFSFYDRSKITLNEIELAIRLLSLRPRDYFSAIDCGAGDALVAANKFVKELACKNIPGTQSPDSTIRIDGSESNTETVAIGKLRLLLSGMDPAIIKSGIDPANIKRSFNFYDYILQVISKEEDIEDYQKPSVLFLNYKNGESFNPDLDRKKKFTKLRSIKVENRVIKFPVYAGELYYTLIMLKLLPENGRMGVIVPFRVMFDESCREVWEFLVEKDYLEKVVFFDLQSFLERQYFYNPYVLLILNKNKASYKKERFLFVNVQHNLWGDSTLDLIPDSEIERVYNVAKTFKGNGHNEIIIEKDKITHNKYNLFPLLYFKHLITNSSNKTFQKFVRLSDLATIRSGPGSIQQATGQLCPVAYVSPNDLSTDINRPFLDFEKIEKKYINREEMEKFTVKRRCILVSLSRKYLKVSIYDPEIDEPVLLTPDVAAIYPKAKKLGVEFLYYMLYENIVRNQILSFLHTDSENLLPTLLLFRSLMLPVPEKLKSQHNYIEQKKRVTYEKLISNREKALNRIEKFYGEKLKAEFDVVRHLAHNINHLIFMVQAPIENTFEFLQKRGLLDETLYRNTSDNTHVMIRDELEKALRSLEEIYKCLRNTRDFIVEGIKEGELEELDICEFFKEIKQTYSNQKLQVQIICNLKPKDRKILLNRFSFQRAIDNLVSNAQMHGLTENRNEIKLEFDIAEDDDKIIIHYTNNGKKFPKDMSKEDFLAIGKKGKSSSGQGLGGAWIKRFIDAHNGEFEIVRDEHPLHFKIVLMRRNSE